MKQASKTLCLGLVAVSLSTAALQAARSEVILDNTANLSQSLSSSGLLLNYGVNQGGVGEPCSGLVLQTGQANLLVTNVVVGLVEPGGFGQYGMYISLYNVDAQNNPANLLARDSFVVLIGGPAYYQLPLTSPGWNLGAGQNYMVSVICWNSPGPEWATTTAAQPPASSPWATYLEYRHTDGSQWSSSSVFGAIEINAAVIPEPSSLVLVSLGIASLVLHRLKVQAGKRQGNR